ncbi:MAG: sulfatase-like hydrolase/transferase [bacterium]|nr:sulfatase-like hydrolase/transferase [bacterium]
MTALRTTTFLLLITFLTGCGGGSDRPDRPDAPKNVLLIYIDTIRADHMALYGYRRPNTPHMESFAATGVTFEQAKTPSSWTRASFASYFTGMLPSVHGCENRDGFIDEGLTTLPERFKAQGFHTAGIYANDNIAGGLGFGRGFDIYDHPPARTGYRGDQEKVTGAREMNARIMEWFRDERPTDQPWFLFALYVDPHDPYMAHRDLAFGEPMTRAPRGARHFLKKWDKAKEKKSQAQVERDIIHLYDSEIAYVDLHIGDVLDTLAELGLADDTMVIISADHGEGLWDHEDYRSHGHLVYEEQVHVPLIVRWPGITPPGLRVSEPVPTLDVYGLLANAYGLAEPNEHQSGDLYDWFVGQGQTRHLYVEELLDSVDMNVVQDGKWKLIDDRGRDRLELYDLEADPDERVNLAESEPGRVERLLELLEIQSLANEAFRAGLTLEGGEAVLTDEEKAGLKALGY